MTDYKCNACGKVLEYEYATCACGNQQPEKSLREMAEEHDDEEFIEKYLELEDDYENSL